MSRPSNPIKAHIYTRHIGSSSGILTYHGAVDAVHVLNGRFDYMRFLSDGSIVLTVETDTTLEVHETDDERRLIIK